jgi:hypothetical protein
MLYPIRSDRFGNLQVVVEVKGFNPPKILVNGQPTLPGKDKNQFIVKSETGIETTIDLTVSNLFDILPTVELNGSPVRIAKPLAWYECVVIALPLILIGIGGAIGGMVGAIAVTFTRSVMRSNLNPVLRYAASIGVTFIAVIVWLMLALIIRKAMGL